MQVEDASGFRGEADALHAPVTEEELRELLREASRGRTPVTVAGAGTGVAGGRVPVNGGIVISIERFRKLEIGTGEATCGAGVLLRDLQAAARQSRQFYAPDPTETAASIGGTIATNASGSRSFRFGDTRRHILSLRVALIDGRVVEYRRGEAIDFDTRAIRRPATTKHSAGFLLQPGMDWIDLLAGSEGTLGVVTEATVRLLPAPRELLTGVVFFADDDTALASVDEWRPIEGLQMLEYFDAGSLDLLRPEYGEIPRRARAALLVEQEITAEDDVDAWESRLARALEESWFGVEAADRERFRRFRHALPEAVNATVRRRGLMKMGSDCAVPLERNGEMMRFYRERLEAEFPGRYVIFGHIGDAHVHANMLPGTPQEAQRAQDLLVDFARRAVELGGTVSAEHGLGKRKAHLLPIQYGAADIEAMCAVKRRLDPEWLLGRGTLLPVPAVIKGW